MGGVMSHQIKMAEEQVAEVDVESESEEESVDGEVFIT